MKFLLVQLYHLSKLFYYLLSLAAPVSFIWSVVILIRHDDYLYLLFSLLGFALLLVKRLVFIPLYTLAAVILVKGYPSESLFLNIHTYIFSFLLTISIVTLITFFALRKEMNAVDKYDGDWKR